MQNRGNFVRGKLCPRGICPGDISVPRDRLLPMYENKYVMRMYVCTVIVIVISKLLKRHLKAKHRALAYSRALRKIREVVQRVVKGSPSPVAKESVGAEQVLRRVSFRSRIGRWRIKSVRV